MKTLSFTLTESDSKLILEGIASLEAHWDHICTQSDDADEIADFGNYLIELRLLARSFAEKAVDVVGEKVLNFGREQF